MKTIEQVNILCDSLEGLKDTPDIGLMFNEEGRFFFRVPIAISIPSFPVHHDLHNETPPDDYTARLVSILNELTAQVPELFAGTRMYFDPARAFQPFFQRLLSTSAPPMALRVQLDLRVQPEHDQIIRSADNDYTAEYITRDIYADAELVPVKEDGLTIEQLLNPTWIGERGRGYTAQGIWIDRDITRFFTALVEPAPARLYPYYPFSSRFRSLTHRPPSWKQRDVELSTERLRQMSAAVVPLIPDIEHTFRTRSFSRDLPLLQELSGCIPPWIRESFEGVRCRRSLTSDGQMEYTLERAS